MVNRPTNTLQSWFLLRGQPKGQKRKIKLSPCIMQPNIVLWGNLFKFNLFPKWKGCSILAQSKCTRKLIIFSIIKWQSYKSPNCKGYCYKTKRVFSERIRYMGITFVTYRLVYCRRYYSPAAFNISHFKLETPLVQSESLL